MDSEEVDRRVEAAKADAVRVEETAEFLRGLKPGDETLRPIYNPEAYVFRSKARAAAKRGELKRNECRHPDQYLRQYVDFDPGRKRDGRPCNLYECGICHQSLWMVDAWGKDKPDG